VAARGPRRERAPRRSGKIFGISGPEVHGLIADRKDSGAPGEVAALSTEAEVMDAVRRELGDAAADALLVSLADTPEPEQPAAFAAPEATRRPNDKLN
jgi:hypothetical protein